ncbi:MAG: hypothetical protein IJ113_01245 [Eggerthellaceae bacterium]|nr:hypothetical protein [Eggerthellaceae bacterium]
MALTPYFGTYGRFVAREKAQASTLMGADTLVGDELVLRVETREGKTHVFVDNRFGGSVGELDAETAGVVQLNRAKDWTVRVLLASVYRAPGDDASFWGEVVVLAYGPAQAAAFDMFSAEIARLLGEGVRPEVNLSGSSVDQIVESGGTWLPKGRHAKPNEREGVLIKDQLSLNDKMVEQARKRNPGCMVAGWAFIGLLVVLALYLLKVLLGL